MNGKIVWCGVPIAKRAEPNLKLLSQIIRSEEPLPPVAREWLADLFDPAADSEFQVKTLARRARGPGRTTILNNWDAAEYAESRIESGEGADDPQAHDQRPDKYAEAVKVAAEKFGISESAVKSALRMRRLALAQYEADRTK
jgi:hypothetical protein